MKCHLFLSLYNEEANFHPPKTLEIQAAVIKSEVSGTRIAGRNWPAECDIFFKIFFTSQNIL